MNRLYEPSTHSAIAVGVITGSLWVNSLTVEGLAVLPWLLGWACVHAVAGVFMREG